MRLEHVNIDHVDLLERLEIENVSPASRGEIDFSCPLTDGHAFGDTRPSARMNSEENVWMCHGCGARGTVVDLVAKVKDVGPLEAMRFLREQYGFDYRAPEGGSLRAELELRRQQAPEQRVPLMPVESDWLGLRGSFYCAWWSMRASHAFGVDTGPGSYMFNRGFLVSTLRRFELGYDTWSERVTIPVRDENGVLIGFKGRAIDERPPKYLVLGDTERRKPRYGSGYGFDPYEVSQVVFGLDKALRVDSKRLVICEGELNAIALHQAGVTDAVALGGSGISERQAELVRWHADEVVLFLDSDFAGEKGVGELVDALGLRMVVKLVEDHEGDPASMSPSGARQLVTVARPWMQVLAGDL